MVPALAERESAQGSRQGKLILGSSLPNPKVGFRYLPCSVIAKRHTNPLVMIEKTLAEALMGKLAAGHQSHPQDCKIQESVEWGNRKDS